MVGGFGNRTPLHDNSIPIQFRTWGMRDWMYERESYDFTRFITICVTSVEVGAHISRAEASARIRSILLRPQLDSRFASDITISDILHRAGILPDKEYVSFFPQEHPLYRDVEPSSRLFTLERNLVDRFDDDANEIEDMGLLDTIRRGCEVARALSDMTGPPSETFIINITDSLNEFDHLDERYLDEWYSERRNISFHTSCDGAHFTFSKTSPLHARRGSSAFP